MPYTCDNQPILLAESAQSFGVVWDKKNALRAHFLPWPALLELLFMFSFQGANLFTCKQLSSFIHGNNSTTGSKYKAYELPHVVSSCAALQTRVEWDRQGGAGSIQSSHHLGSTGHLLFSL